jgi:ribosomal protein L3
VAENQVVQVKTDEKEGYTSLQLGADESVKPRRVSKPVLGHLQVCRSERSPSVADKGRLLRFRIQSFTNG